jgi:hypothetical protein
MLIRDLCGTSDHAFKPNPRNHAGLNGRSWDRTSDLPLVESVPIEARICAPVLSGHERFQAERPERSGTFL